MIQAQKIRNPDGVTDQAGANALVDGGHGDEHGGADQSYAKLRCGR